MLGLGLTVSKWFKNLGVVLVAGGVISAGFGVPVASAAGLSVQLMINDDVADHRVVEVGGITAGFNVQVWGGTATNFRWWIDNTSLATVTGSGSEAHISGLAQGVTKLWVEVSDGGSTARDSSWITVYYSLPPTSDVVVLKGAKIYRAADAGSTFRGTVSANQKAEIYAYCHDWVRLRFPAGYVFSADSGLDSRNGWVKRSDVHVPATSVSLGRDYDSVARGDSLLLTPTFLQDYADDVKFGWSSSDKSIVRASEAGVATGVFEGVASVTVQASSSHGVSVSSVLKVSVFSGVEDETRGVLRAAAMVSPAAESSAVGVANVVMGDPVQVLGVAGSFFFVETADGVTGFLPKAVVNIPVTDVLLEPAGFGLEPGTGQQMSATVFPSLASDNHVVWSSSNRSVAEVSASGLVSSRKDGEAQISASAGGVTASVSVSVGVGASDLFELPVAAVDRLSLSVDRVSLSKILLRDISSGGCYYLWDQKVGSAKKWSSETGGSYDFQFNCAPSSGVETKSVSKSAWGKQLQWRLSSSNSKNMKSVIKSVKVAVMVGKSALQLVEVGADRAVLSWTPVFDSKGYGVYRCNAKGKSCKQVGSAVGERSVEFTVTGLKADTGYVFKVAAALKCSATRCSKFVRVANKKSGQVVYSNSVPVQTLLPVSVHTINWVPTDSVVLPRFSAGLGVLEAPNTVKADRASNTSVKLSWSPVGGAQSYTVYRYRSGKWKVAKTVSGTSLTVKKLKKGGTHKFAVVACDAPKGTGVCSVLSETVAVKTYKKKDKKVNAGGVSVGAPNVLGLRDTWVLDVKLSPAKFGSAKGKKVYDQQVRFSSSDPSVASIDADGMVTGLQPGSTVVSAVSHNGYRSSVNVSVKNLAATINPVGVRSEVTGFAQVHGAKIAELVSWAVEADVERYLYPNLEGGVTVAFGDLPADIQVLAEQIMLEDYPRVLHIELDHEKVIFFIYLNGVPQGQPGSHHVRLEYQPVHYDKAATGGWFTFDHWTQTYVSPDGPGDAVGNQYDDEEMGG